MENINNNSAPQIPNAAAQILARNRQVAQKYGPYFGKQLFTIVAVNPDPKYFPQRRLRKSRQRFLQKIRFRFYSTVFRRVTLR